MRLRRWIGGVLVALGGALLIVVPAFAAGVFTDVSNSPYETAIYELADRGVILGFDDNTFRPSDPVKRQQFAKMIVKTLNLTVTGTEICPFSDVGAQVGVDPFYPSKYVAVCANSGITVGYPGGLFKPFDSISRQQLITMVARAANLPDPPTGYDPGFSAGQFSADHYQNARKAAYASLLGGLQGVGSSYDFFAPASRGECAQLLYNLILLQGGGGGSTTSTTQPPTSTTTSTTLPPTSTTTSTTQPPSSTTTTMVPPGGPLQILFAQSQPDAPGDDNQNLNEEYITFKVLVSGSLKGYAVEDAVAHRYNFPDRTFTAGQVFRLRTGQGVDTQTDLYWGATGQAIWNNNGDTIKILDSQGHVLTSYTY